MARANENDGPLLEKTLKASLAPKRSGAHLCLDAAYDSLAIRVMLKRRKITPHIRSRLKERQLKIQHRGKARRWVVERAHSWMNRFRRLLIRWEKLTDSYLGMLQLACATICYQRT